jgi:hypothetical protein
MKFIMVLLVQAFGLASCVWAQNDPKYNTTLAILVPDDKLNFLSLGRPVPADWAGSHVVQVNYAQIETQSRNQVSRLFSDIKLVRNLTQLEALGSVLLVTLSPPEIAHSYMWGFFSHDAYLTVSMEFSVRGADENTKLKQRCTAPQKSWEWVDYPEHDEKLNTATLQSIETCINALVRDFDTKPELQELAMAVASSQAADGSELQGLEPLLASYRVSESEGIVRRRPLPKSGVVKKLGMGSIVQIIGQLPSGWLQVAKEGEAIGWIHSGSVTAMQQAGSTTVAKAAPPPVLQTPSALPAALPPTVPDSAFPVQPVAVSFPRGKANPDDIAVIIGNASYKATAKDIPDVVPAYADAEGMKRYATQVLGIREENIIALKDARLADLIATFGNDNNPKGKLWNWVKANRSQVFVFYSGHGAPSSDGSSSYLVPVDATASLIDLSGYSLKTLYANLGKLPAKSVTVVLEACFSGASQNGMLIKHASPIYQKAMQEIVPTNLTVISAGSGSQIASWEQDKSHGLFTKHYLLGMAGAADKRPYGNGDGKVTHEELGAYLKGTMSYLAQRYYGREQTVQIVTSGR